MSSATDEPQDPETSTTGLEPLACVACRSRKLKCDRVKPACTRCARVSSDCVYPESRRKPTVKRRNVKELEARLEQVESLLRGASGNGPNDGANNGSNETSPDSSNAVLEETIDEDSARVRAVNDIPGVAYRMQVPFSDPDLRNPSPSDWTTNDAQLMEQGLSESLPPWEVIEELTNAYFNTSHYYFPIIHPERYLHAMHGIPLMRPPMCLQYMVWAIAAYHHDVYSGYSDVFYRRARLYFERDEMKGDGEYFVTIQHAQALGLLASYEAKRMLFTRASMNTAKCVRLVYMMGLDKLDGDGPPKRAPALSEPRSWLELEERRRTFWGAFAIDSHASASTGWPSLISEGDVTTRLPASEEAFRSGIEESAMVLDEVFEGGQYSNFAGTIVTCHVLKTIQQTLQYTKASDRPEDVLDGPYWQKHRDLDSKLTSLFIFLPEHFRLLNNPKEPAAIHLNLNLHASAICLHHHAIEQADKYNLDASVKIASLARMRSAAMEIASISKSSAHLTPIFKSPLCALSLYSATTVFVYVAKTNPTAGLNSFDRHNLELILKLMEAISHIHEITKAFLLQAWLDIERNGLTVSIRMPNLIKSGKRSNLSDFPMTPIVTRTSVAEHSEINPILPGRLPLGNAQPARTNLANQDLSSISRKDATSGRLETMANLLDSECFAAVLGAVTRNVGPQQAPVAAVPEMNRNKRKRSSASPGPETVSGTTGKARPGQNVMGQTQSALCGGSLGRQGYEIHVLPDRTGSSASSSPAYRGTGTETQVSGSTHTSPSVIGLGNTLEENRVDLRHLQGRVATPIWDGNEQFFMGEVTDEMITQALQSGCEPWGMLATDLQWTGGTGHGT